VTRQRLYECARVGCSIRLASPLELEPELRGDDDLVAHGCQRLADQLLIRKRRVRFSRIEKRDPAVDGGLNDRDAVLATACATTAARQVLTAFAAKIGNRRRGTFASTNA